MPCTASEKVERSTRRDAHACVWKSPEVYGKVKTVLCAGFPPSEKLSLMSVDIPQMKT